jgi:hypothetical protein
MDALFSLWTRILCSAFRGPDSSVPTFDALVERWVAARTLPDVSTEGTAAPAA